jgi:hypothetical protein
VAKLLNTDWRESARAWERRALDNRAQIRELEQVIVHLKRERDEWRRLAERELKAKNIAENARDRQ